jgi:hypothetical protein
MTNIMKDKLLAINVSNSTEAELIDIQKELFNNGYFWKNNSYKIKNYIRDSYILIINNNMYIMSKNNYDSLSKDNDITIISDIKTYFRIKKIKKIKNER